MSLLVSVLFFYAFVKVSRVTEDVVRNREGSVRFFILNIFEMAWIHYITSFKRQKIVYFVTSYLDSVHFYVLVLECSEKKLPFDSPPWMSTSVNIIFLSHNKKEWFSYLWNLSEKQTRVPMALYRAREYHQKYWNDECFSLHENLTK